MKTQGKIILGIVVLGFALWAAGKAAALYAEYLWFDALAFGSVFVTVLRSQVVLGVGVFVATAVWLGGHAYLAARLSPGRRLPLDRLQLDNLQIELSPARLRRWIRIAACGVIAAVALGFGLGASAQWFEVQQFLHRQTFEWTDPVLERNARFYVFVLPMLVSAKTYLLAFSFLGLVAAALAYLLGGGIVLPAGRARITLTRSAARHLSVLVALFFALVAFGYWLDRFNLMLSSRGTVFGAGYADVHARIPALNVMVVASLLCAGLVLAAGLMRRKQLAVAAVIGLMGGHLIVAKVYPAAVQRFDVQPNELERETPYLEHNIAATRFAYGLGGVEVKQYAGTGTLALDDLEALPGTIGNVRLWDWRVLEATYNQIERLRPYYKFPKVDVDRYKIDGQYRQVSVAVRELDTSLLPPKSQTWVNLNLMYTHGYGLCMSPVNAVTPEGLPALWIGGIPPQVKVPIPVRRSAVYFGRLTRSRIFVRTQQQEFDYPMEDENRFTTYEGKAGVPLPGDSFWRKLLFAYYFGDFNILLTDSFTAETRVLWRREIRTRVRRVAPFLEYDKQAYPVIHDGRLVWILDAYTRTARFPYSARVVPRSRSANYIRNAVKVVIDAYDGNLTFYVADPDDALVSAAWAIFPDLFRPMEEMPEGLRAHLRYPVDLFEIQAQQYLTYHMTDPRVFYNKEDLWQRAKELYEDKSQTVASYYIIMTLPDETEPEYLLMLPLTPARTDNLVAWMAGRCDGEQYGKLLVYTFPKDRLFFGPNQIEARIDANDEISASLSLWNQRGSRVVRGNLLVIPIRDTILFVEPLYMKSEIAEIPELKRVIVAYQNRIAMRPTLDEALAAVLSGPVAVGPPTETPPDAPAPETSALSARALELFSQAQRQMREGDWGAYGETIDRLGKVLEQMVEEASRGD